MGKFQLALPAPLRPENGAVKEGDDNAGYMYTRGHKFAPGDKVIEPEDFVLSLSNEFCTVGGVFDGHGGTVCPRACADFIVPRMANEYKTLTHTSTCAIFGEAQTRLAQLASQTGDQSGTTATVAVVTEENITLAYVGDSRACVIKTDGRAVFLTGAHRPCDEAEKARVVEQGGYVTEPSGQDDVHRVNGIYAVSRCLGNIGADGTAGLSQEPEFLVYARQPEDRLLLIASDGVWDFLDETAVAKVATAAAAKGEDMAGVALAVVKRAFVQRSNDDIAVFATRLAAPAAATAPATIPACLTPAADTPLPPTTTLPKTPAVILPGEALGADAGDAPGLVHAACTSMGSLDAARDASGVGAAPPPRRASSGVQQGPYTRRVSRDATEQLASAAVAAAAVGGSAQPEVRESITPAAAKCCGADPGLHALFSACDSESVSHTPRCAAQRPFHARLGCVLRWSVTLAAAAAGAAFIARRRRF